MIMFFLGRSPKPLTMANAVGPLQKVFTDLGEVLKKCDCTMRDNQAEIDRLQAENAAVSTERARAALIVKALSAVLDSTPETMSRPEPNDGD